MNPPAQPSGHVHRPRIVLIDDELYLTDLLEKLIKRQIGEATILTFQNRDAGWQELLRRDPDLLITDMNNDNVPGRSEYLGMSGWKMLPMLAERAVKYPILVVSGSFLIPGVEAEARKCAGRNLNISFMPKPFAPSFFVQEVNRLLAQGDDSGGRLPSGTP